MTPDALRGLGLLALTFVALLASGLAQLPALGSLR